MKERVKNDPSFRRSGMNGAQSRVPGILSGIQAFSANLRVNVISRSQ